jgi:probable rRNA maturation factor
MAITFQNQEIVFRLPGRVKLKSWIRKVLRQEGKKEGDLNYVFTSDERLHEMNVEYLGHDTLTDIITFDQSEGLVVSGDIVISRDRVAENAVNYKTAFDDELHRVMIHGVLHLCGYRDKTEEEKKLMRSKEDEALRLFVSMPR